MLLSHLSTSVVSFDKHCRLLIQKFQQFIFSCESGIWLQGISQGDIKDISKISEKSDEIKMRYNEKKVNYAVSGTEDRVTGATTLTRMAGFTECTGLYWDALGCTGRYWAVLGCTGLYWGVLGCTGLYCDVLGCT